MYGVSPLDPPTVGVVVVTLLLTGIGAASIPARRATQVDPVHALTSE